MFRQTMRTIRIVIQAATLMPRAPGQYWITSAAADISAHWVMAQEYQFYMSELAAVSYPARSFRTYVPANSKPHGTVHIARTELGNCTGERQPGSHFTETLHLYTSRQPVFTQRYSLFVTHHGENGETGQRVAKQKRQGTRLGKSIANTKEKASADSTTQRDKLDMTGFETNRL